MQDEPDRAPDALAGGAAPVAVLSVVAVPELHAWSVRMQVPHATGLATGWAPFVFWSEHAAAGWLDQRLQRRVRPTVRACDLGTTGLALACVTTEDGDELLVSEPLPRMVAAGVAAMFAAEFRARAR